MTTRVSISRPQTRRALPKDLSESDVDALPASPDTSTPWACGPSHVEGLCACGLRVSELFIYR